MGDSQDGRQAEGRQAIGSFDFRAAERAAQDLWEANGIRTRARDKAGKDAPTFYFLDGPPYTSGKVHLGTTWNKVLKDMVLRYKRMKGFRVWERAGYDMHGLPTEHATEKELGIHGAAAIMDYGKERFIESCRSLCIRNMHEMNKVFLSLGVWMDFTRAYQSITKEFMEGEWWFVKTAHEKGRLYEGERTMTWDAVNGTALAKHELEYKSVTDTAIYVALPLVGEDASLVIWTTTPWTIPFNLAVMANPDIAYCRIALNWKGKEERWYVAKDLLDDFVVDKIGTGYIVERELLGKELAGKSYTHPFFHDNDVYAALKAKMPNVHTVIMSTEYVDTSAGTGLVHCAPGCGPEDYEVGHRNGIKPFNSIDPHGVCRDLPPFNGLEAKKDDDEFIRLIDEKGALLHTHRYAHDYPHGERSKQPVIFRTTKQWFLKVEDIKDDLIKANNTIHWVPDAAYNAFNSWLENLRDNSISKQRFWGTPIPIWRSTHDPSDYIVVGSAKELKELAGLDEEPADLHSPSIDHIIIKQKGKDNKQHEYHRIPDVLDVWVDAGTVSWNCLDFPARHDLLKDWSDRPDGFGADFILEGKDQIRGWYNLLHIASMISFGKPAFKAVYMHGFINDSQGRKMSKSLGNYILPEEVTSKYGVDCTRYYMIGAANPGLDMNYNMEDTDAKFRNLLVYWNLHKYALEHCHVHDIVPRNIMRADPSTLAPEERYLQSRLHHATKRMDELFSAYALNEIPAVVEEFLLDVSRTYIQLIRDKASGGSEEEKQQVADALVTAVLEGMTLMAPIAPFFSETVYQHLRAAFPAECKEESIHLRSWPAHDDAMIDERLEADFLIAKDCIGAILAARDKAQLGVRWPVDHVRVECTPAQADALRRMEALILLQTNVKALRYDPPELTYTITPNTKTLGKAFGKETQAVMRLIEKRQRDLAAMVRENAPHAVIDDDGAQRTILPEHIAVERHVPDNYQAGNGNTLNVYLSTVRTPALEREGYAREIIRRIQQLRKNAGLVKTDRIIVELATTDAMLRATIDEHAPSIAERTGSRTLQPVATLSQGLPHVSTETIKGTSIIVGFTVV